MYGVENLPESTNFGKVIWVEPRKKSLKPIPFFPAPKTDSNQDTNENEER
jgi:hypothetical protein